MGYFDYYMDADGFGAECPDNWEIHAEIINAHIDALIAEDYLGEDAAEAAWAAYCDCQYDEEIAELTRKTALQVAEQIRRNVDWWDFELLEKLCCMAEMWSEWCQADRDNCEDVAREAARRLGVEID